MELEGERWIEQEHTRTKQTPPLDPLIQSTHIPNNTTKQKNNSALTAFLYHGGGPRHRVDAAFIWSVGTWDVAAIHPISTSLEGTYADWEIVKWMRWLSAQAPSRR